MKTFIFYSENKSYYEKIWYYNEDTGKLSNFTLIIMKNYGYKQKSEAFYSDWNSHLLWKKNLLN